MTFVVAAALLLLAGSASFAAQPPAGAPSPGTATDSAVRLTAEPMLGGRARAGSWMAVRVTVSNDGPAIDGELRMSLPTRSSATTYSVVVQLATGARQEHVLYGQTPFAGGRQRVSLVSGSETLASVDVRIDTLGLGDVGLYVIAEHPEALIAPLRAAFAAGGRPAPTVVTVGLVDLPPRVEAWSAIDLLVWQDVDAEQLDPNRLEALRTWAAAGGALLVVGGSTGHATLRAFPADMLPYSPATVVDVPVEDLAQILGGVPAGGTTLPALAGPLQRGVVIGGAGDSVIAARTPYGQGSVALVGIDPATPWLAESGASATLLGRVLPAGPSTATRDGESSDDFIVGALSNLPTVQLPRPEHLLLLILAYIVTLGPVNYFALRRRDRREWAWLSMPLTIVAFAVMAYGLGFALKGANIVVNELAVVHGAAGGERGLARVYVGVYSPRREEFEVRIGDRVLLSPAATSGFGASSERPLDVLLGDPATARGYSIGFGALRALRAETVLPTPLVEADLRLVDGRLTGSVANASAQQLDDVSIVYANSTQDLGDLAPGETRSVDLSTERELMLPLSQRLFPGPSSGGPDVDPATARSVAARRAVVQHLSGGWDEWTGATTSNAFGGAPTILAWSSGARLPIDVGAPTERVGETLYLLRARVTVSGPVTYTGNLLRGQVVASDAAEFWSEGSSLYLSRGTIEMEYRPPAAEGTFGPSRLLVQLAPTRRAVPDSADGALVPLPAAEQPDQRDPLTSDPRPGDGPRHVPRLQLFDRVAGLWIEFEPLELSHAYEISDPGRFVDDGGTLRVRFVARSFDYTDFSFGARLEGEVR
ncbi:MAG TPA: hypothetical protein VMP67_06815 [Candidatus Limnocylindria bacterium]|nr:hypothetical protein [Candidatus Limnocylindria bacterium]